MNQTSKPTLHIITFVIATLVLSWIISHYLVFDLMMNGSRNYLTILAIYVWTPTLISFIYRFFLNIGFSDIGWARNKPRVYVYAILLSLACALVANIIAVLMGLNLFTPLNFQAISEQLSTLFFSLSFGFVCVFGEEITWRGFLLPQLLRAKVRYPYIISSLIASIWWLPILNLSGYSVSLSPVVVVLYALSATITSILLCILRMNSGSVWLTTVFHFSHNFFQSWIPILFFSTEGPNASWSQFVGGGGSGLIVAVLHLGIVLLLLRNKNFAALLSR